MSFEKRWTQIKKRWKSNQEGMDAKTGAQIKTIRGKMDNGQEDMKGQAGSIASRIDVNQEENKGHVGCLSRKDGGKSRRTAVRSGATGGP
jgi:hypothetical protein